MPPKASVRSSRRALREQLKKKTSTITITYGDVAEHHAGMKTNGKGIEEGFSARELEEVAQKLRASYPAALIELIRLNQQSEEGQEEEEAALLVVRNGVDVLLGEGKADDFFDEQAGLNHDTKFYAYGTVKEKVARHNLCFWHKSEEPDYERKQGRTIVFDHVPVLSAMRAILAAILGEKAQNLAVEGNYYYDVKKCGIGPHGDGERKFAAGVRLGHDMPFHFQWYKNSMPVGQRARLLLSHGDLYITSQKAVGTDWKKRKIATLRHSAGYAERFIRLKEEPRERISRLIVRLVDEDELVRRRLVVNRVKGRVTIEES